MRAAIYARFSTELQNDESIDDQEALCRACAAREGHEVVQVYSDAAKSGGSIQGRPGVQQLMRDAGQDRFQVIIVEALDRLSRDMEDLAGMYKRLKFGGIKILAVHEGQVNTVLVGLRGLVGQLMREDNLEKVRRGMTGLISRGLSAGGLAYGYRVNPEKKGAFLVVPEQAATVKEIFERYVAGQSPRKIAYDLNDRGVPPPRRGSKWNASTINGWADRGSGILHNQLYVGKYVWNKNQFVKPQDSDKRISRANPPSEWKSMELPELRIISDELFEAAQRERKTISEKNFAVRRRPQRLLSGLLKCGSCGSGMAVWGKELDWQAPHPVFRLHRERIVPRASQLLSEHGRTGSLRPPRRKSRRPGGAGGLRR